MTSRDPGKIAKAFPSRARNIMANLTEFDRAVRAEVEHWDRKANALAAEAGSGKTSRRSPSRPSASERQSLTGVRERPDQQGWTDPATALPHLCFPPNQYPSGVGPGSQWKCRCGAVWMASGIAWEDYPTDPSRTAQPLAPERWFYISGGQLPEEDYRDQEGLYDWRPLGPYYVKLLRALLDNHLLSMGMSTKPPITWESLG